MFYAFIENDLIFIASDPNLVPQGLQVFEVETDNPHEYTIENGAVVKKSSSVLLDELKLEAIKKINSHLSSLLEPTDWIIIKCTELNVNPSSEYPEQTQQRQLFRDQAAEAKSAVREATDAAAVNAALSSFLSVRPT